MRREDGATVVELLAAVVLGSLLVGSLVALVIVGFRSYESAKRTLLDGAAVNDVRASLTDDARSAAALLSSVSPDGLTLTLVVFDASAQATGRRTLVYRYVSDGTITRSVSVGTSPASTQVVARNLAASYASPVFSLAGGAVLANVPLPSSPVQTVEVRVATRVISP